MEIILSHEKLPNKKAEILKRLKGNTNFINNRAMLIDSTDNGKKYIICLDSQKNEADFLRLSYKYYNSSPKKLSSENEKKEIIYNSEDELRNKLFQNSILRKAVGCKNIFIVHGTFGWQQVFNSYIYRNVSSIEDSLHCNEFDDGYYCFEYKNNIDMNQLTNYYNGFIEQINLLPHNFTLPLLAYCVFSYVKSLYKQYGHKLDISKTDRYFALNILGTENTKTNQYIIEYVKKIARNSIKGSKKIKDEAKNIAYATVYGDVKIGKFMCKDFSVFSYNIDGYDPKVKNKISSSIFHNSVTSNISYIYYNINDFDDYLLNLSVANDFVIPSQDIDINSDSFICLLNGYLDYISKELSYETYQKEKIRKEKLIKKIYDEDYYDNISPYIENFLYDICRILQDRKIPKSEYFYLILFNDIDKLTMKEFETLEKEYRDDSKVIYNNFAKKFYDKHLLRYEHQLKNKKIYKGPTDYIESIKYKMKERHIEMLVNSSICISKHHPKFFDNLYKEALDFLTKNHSDPIQCNRWAFLLASMKSFKFYIDDWLPEVSEDFKKYFLEFQDIVVQMSGTPQIKYIDEKTALSELAAFIKIKIESCDIIDTELGADSKIGWIDRKKNKIYLKNTCGNNFYDDFQKYLISQNERIEHSKQAFVRDILEAKGIINARYAGGGKRYDSERKIGDKKYRVLVLDCNLLEIL